MKERPILFSAPMVRAILSGQKSVTRRIVKPVRGYEDCSTCRPDKAAASHSIWWHGRFENVGVMQDCPFGQSGDRLYVRETWSDVNLQGAPGIAYRADDEIRDLMEDETFLDDNGAFNYDDPRSKPYQFCCWAEDLISGTEGRWRPSIHMPRWASRILLEITDVRVERLQDITPIQALAEGVKSCERDLDPDGNGYSPHELFSMLWISINGMESWNVNPLAWVVEFKQVTP